MLKSVISVVSVACLLVIVRLACVLRNRHENNYNDSVYIVQSYQDYIHVSTLCMSSPNYGMLL